MKGTVIFADQPTEEQKFRSRQTDITVTKNELQEAVKEAYEKGVEDAKKELKKEEAPTNDPDAWQANLTAEQREGVKKGEIKAAEEEAKKREQTKQKLDAIADKHDVILFTAKTVFPFSIFPDTLVIDTTKITIVRKQMFATENIITVPHKDIADASVQTALFLATFTLTYTLHTQSPGAAQPITETISSLRREDAIKAKNLIKGILVARAESIDISKIEPDELLNTIERFGHTDGVV